MRRSTWYPVGALGALAAVDALHGLALLVLGPDIARTLGVGPAVIASVAVLTMLAAAVGALAAARLAAAGMRRARMAVVTGGVWSAASMLTGVVTGPWGLAGVAVADGAASGTVQAVHPSLVADLYRGRGQVRALASHRAINAGGVVVAPVLIAALSAAGLTWRGVFVVAGAAGVLCVLGALRLRDPPAAAPADHPATRLGLSDHARALLVLPTMRRVLAAYAVAGVLLAPLLSYLFFFLEDRWGLDAAGRGAFLATSGLVTVIAIALFADVFQRRAERSAAALVDGAWPLAVLGGLALPLAAAAPWFGVSIAALCASLAALALIEVPLLALLVRLAPGPARPVATGLAGVALAGVGGIGGVLLLSGAEDTLGTDAALGIVGVPAVLAGLVLRTARRTADADVAAAAEREGRRRAPMARGADVPAALAVEQVSFGYDEHRALDGVSLSADAGEIIVVLGTNGAGKSTLLGIVSGLLAPVRGSVRLGGQDVTWLTPERRVRLGLAHVPAESATFAALTVRENLYVAALALGSRPEARRQADALLGALPQLTARADVPAHLLSGGEARLLAVAQALVLKPRVLLLDEPTRGLQPGTAGSLLDQVRAVASAGAAVVLVEQSVRPALAAATRAMFLEAGSVRYDGPPDGLLERPDLLRPVFLQDATHASEAAAGSTAAARAPDLRRAPVSGVIPPGGEPWELMTSNDDGPGN